MKHTAYAFPYGTIVLEYENDVLYKLRCTPEEKQITSELMRDRSEFSDGVYRQVQEFLAGKRRNFDVKYCLNGTDFQMKVWAALRQIPYGETRSYKQIAEALGQPKAVRAVGMANNKNPLMLLIPCHRVIGSDGSLVGYAGGLEMKQALLAAEQRSIGSM
ncbi:MAG: methylated-DNA--[protein]-cysteine S-methyltransferase [Lachnospiraceae bacterium]|nr:methylated-DNA--[protein]-cysteine S-methyltransferase [Lachnospiraceae bacterium]